MIENAAHLEDMEAKSGNLRNTANSFAMGSRELELRMKARNRKIMIIIAIIVVVIILYFIFF